MDPYTIRTLMHRKFSSLFQVACSGLFEYQVITVHLSILPDLLARVWLADFADLASDRRPICGVAEPPICG